MIKKFYLKDRPMPVPSISYPSFWLYLEDYKKEFENRLIDWMNYENIPLEGNESKKELLGHFKGLSDELSLCFQNIPSAKDLNELKELIIKAIFMIYYANENPQIYPDKENLLFRAKEIISALIDEHVEQKSYSQGKDDEYPKTSS